jgi:hypothetical protein
MGYSLVNIGQLVTCSRQHTLSRTTFLMIEYVGRLIFLVSLEIQLPDFHTKKIYDIIITRFSELNTVSI